MLIYQDDADVVPLFCKASESRLDCRVLGFAINDEEVLLGFSAGRHMLCGQVSDLSHLLLAPEFGLHTPMPARSSPVTES